jgi:hypothetical protein
VDSWTRQPRYSLPEIFLSTAVVGFGTFRNSIQSESLSCGRVAAATALTAFHFGPVLGVQRLSDVGPKEDTQAGQRAFLLEKKNRNTAYAILYLIYGPIITSLLRL